MASLDGEDLLEGQAELVGLGRLEVLVLEELLEPGALLGGELSRVLEPQPTALFQVGLGEGFALTHGVHSLIDELHQVEAIEGDLGVGQVFCGLFLEGWREVHADLRNGLGATAMGLQIFGELLQGLGILAGSGEQESPGIQIYEERDVVMTAPTAGFIDADGLDIGHIHRGTSR